MREEQETTVNDLQIKICISLSGKARKSAQRMAAAITFANWLISQQARPGQGRESCINFNKHISREWV